MLKPRKCCWLQWAGWIVLLIVPGLELGCQERSAPNAGGETHWLSACEEGEACAGGSCLCGVCTRTCGGDADCGGDNEAWCYDVASSALERRCEASFTSLDGAICLATCEVDTDCGARLACIGGACVSDPTLSFDDEPGQLEQPLETISLAETVNAEDIIGEWTELYSDGEPCLPQGGGGSFPGCMRLRFTEEANGEIRGTLYWLREDGLQDDWFSAAPGAPINRFGAPEVGVPYPAPEWETFGGYEWGVPYHAFDGVYADGRLAFWFSENDLWSDWCALQVPVPAPPGQSSDYTCTSNAEDEDLFRLCNDTPVSGYCFDDCLCPDIPPEFCAHPVCECSEQSCGAALRERARHVQLDFKDGFLQGSFGTLGDSVSGPFFIRLARLEE